VEDETKVDIIVVGVAADVDCEVFAVFQFARATA
jgi:hypothetical protein